jgi:translation initiation factor IF-3
MQEASSKNLDLVQVSPSEDQEPICKILDFGKMMYMKKKMQSKSAHVKNITKEIRLSFGISEHDLDVKARKASGFLDKRARVKVSLQFKGREAANKQLGIDKLMLFAGKVADHGTLEQEPTFQGRSVSMTIKPVK